MAASFIKMLRNRNVVLFVFIFVVRRRDRSGGAYRRRTPITIRARVKFTDGKKDPKEHG